MISLMPGVLFEWVALNPEMATFYLLAPLWVLSVGAWYGFLKENNYFKQREDR